MATKRWGDGTQTIRSERLFHRPKKKVYYVDLKKNSDGNFLKITEACGGKRDTIVVPTAMADEFVEAIQKVKGTAWTFTPSSRRP
jgi:hypothetical protein